MKEENSQKLRTATIENESMSERHLHSVNRILIPLAFAGSIVGAIWLVLFWMNRDREAPDGEPGGPAPVIESDRPVPGE